MPTTALMAAVNREHDLHTKLNARFPEGNPKTKFEKIKLWIGEQSILSVATAIFITT
jgi:hypothetical protein